MRNYEDNKDRTGEEGHRSGLVFDIDHCFHRFGKDTIIVCIAVPDFGVETLLFLGCRTVNRHFVDTDNRISRCHVSEIGGVIVGGERINCTQTGC